jgi:hypothetical protein
MSRESDLEMLLACENPAVTESDPSVIETETLAPISAPPDDPPQLEAAEMFAEPPASIAKDSQPVCAKGDESSAGTPSDSKSIWLAPFGPNSASLNPTQISAIANLAREIVGQQGQPQVPRSIHLVGNAGGTRTAALTKRRIAAARGTLEEAINCMWPGLTEQLCFMEEMTPVADRQSQNPADESAGRKRAVQIAIESAPPRITRSYPVIVSVSTDKYEWRTLRADSRPREPENIETASGKALRGPSNQGFFYVLSADVAPNRWICSLEINFEPADRKPSPRENPVSLRATGLLISDRHILTAGHCLYSRVQEQSQEAASGQDEPQLIDLLAATSASITPARNSTAPAFSCVSVDDRESLRCSARWQVSRGVNTEFDFGLITLPSALPAALHSWGGNDHHITPLPDDVLRNATVQTAGYPQLAFVGNESTPPLPAGTNEPSTQWTTLGVVSHVGKNRLSHDMPVRPGQDGSPVWLQTGTSRKLVGILGLNQQIVRITPRLLKRLRAWMAQDGVRASF